MSITINHDDSPYVVTIARAGWSTRREETCLGEAIAYAMRGHAPDICGYLIEHLAEACCWINEEEGVVGVRMELRKPYDDFSQAAWVFVEALKAFRKQEDEKVQASL